MITTVLVVDDTTMHDTLIVRKLLCILNEFTWPFVGEVLCTLSVIFN